MLPDPVSPVLHNSTCRLCRQAVLDYLADYSPRFQLFVCPECKLLMKDIAALPGPETEKARYLLHRNSPENVGYVDFLHSFFQRIVPFIAEYGRALDFGCGPQPVLAGILEAHGMHTEVYDPFFFSNQPKGQFDLITCTETAEHFHSPETSFQVMTDLLRNGGILALMTEFYPSLQQIRHWHYLRDITHVSFYNLQTMHYIAQHYGLKLLYTDAVRTVVYQK